MKNVCMNWSKYKWNWTKKGPKKNSILILRNKKKDMRPKYVQGGVLDLIT